MFDPIKSYKNLFKLYLDPLITAGLVCVRQYITVQTDKYTLYSVTCD